ncbi:olfactory receptor 11L1-like [Gastrophryne carolinensis]
MENFWLVGFQTQYNLRIFLFSALTFIYIITLSANGVIIILVASTNSVSSPMYFFLSHLSIIDVLLTTIIVPKMLTVTLNEGSAVSSAACFAQFYFLAQSTITECLLLASMSYDRYTAICNPLCYTSIMDRQRCMVLVIISWASGSTFPLTTVLQLDRMSFCGSKVIDHFFCDLAPILKLSCSDTSIVSLGNIIFSFPLVFFPLVFITFTYIFIFHAILRISSIMGRQKAFSTCSSHLTVVCIYYGTLVINYVIPARQSLLGFQKVVSLLYTMVTPLFNPILYSLRNKELRLALQKCCDLHLSRN